MPEDTELAIDTILGYISAELGGADWTTFDRGVNGYTKTYKTLFGLRVFENPERPEMGVHLIADGECCDAIGLEHLRRIYLGLQMRATRIDLAVDHCAYQPADLRDEWYRDNVRTACKPARTPLPGREGIRSCSWYSSPSGDTFNMGSRQATAFARCYNERGFTRFELELKGQRAASVAKLVLDDSVSTLDVAVAAIRDFVDFVDSASSTNRSRCRLLPFWAQFVSGIERAGVRLEPRPQPTIDRVVDWIEGQVAPSLALYEIYGERFLGLSRDKYRRRLRKLGLARLKPRHDALLTLIAASCDSHANLKTPD